MPFQTTNRICLAAALSAATAAGCAVKLDGKTTGPAGGGGREAATEAPPEVSKEPASSEEEDLAGEVDDDPYAASKARKPPAAPADPWAAVDGDQPRLSPKPALSYRVSDVPNDCSAAHDHCLPPDVWFVESYQYVKDLERSFSVEQYQGLDSDFDNSPWEPFGGAVNVGDKDYAYRTVPATRRHLVAGALAIAMTYPTKVPGTEEHASVGLWVGGVVDEIDWDAGKVRLVGHKTPYWISATRVAVLRWIPGGKVEILGKLGKDALAAKASETFAPMEDQPSVADPWSEVDPKGQPKEPTDIEPLDITSDARVCDAAHDHCLRPWVWFEETTRGAWPVRFHRGAFHAFHDDVTDLGEALDGAAYRTVPADPAKLGKGTRVYFRDTEPDTESEANAALWEAGDVSEVKAAAGVFRIDGDDRYYPLANARVRVVMWFPGEKAEQAD